MGKSISKLRGHMLTRPAQRFNIESRTDSILDTDKPMPAPKYQADIETRQMNLETQWRQMEKDIRAKDEKHSRRLEDVYVTSEDPEGYDSDINRRRPENADRPLPTNTRAWQLTRGFGTPEGYTASSGRITLEAAQTLLVDYSKDPQVYNAGALATKYDIKVADAEAIVQSFKIFTFLKAQSKPMTEEEIARAKDPHLAQPDWVVEAGELPPVIDKRALNPTAIDLLTAKDSAERGKLLGKTDQMAPPKLITNQSVRSPKDTGDTKKISDQ